MTSKSQKIALIAQSTSQEWISCQTIFRNLVKSYRGFCAPEEVQLFQLSPAYSHYEAYQLVSRLRENKIEKLVFVDYAPHPENLIRILAEQNFRPEIVFHIYGDFVLQAGSWLAVEHQLKEFRTHFVCASHKQARLVEMFLKDTQVSVVPFAVDENEFYFSPDLRRLTRAKMGVENDEAIFLYSGRLSLQKNIISLIRNFSFFQRHICPESRLLLAGPVDDLGAPYVGKKSPTGIMNFDIQKEIQSAFGDEKSSCIRYLGNLNTKELNSVCNAADVFISLSGHNDEDYGMAPAEALMTGCYSLLTDWGGYSSFQKYLPEFVTLVPIQMGSSISPTDQDVIKKMAIIPLKTSDEKRKERSEAARRDLSIHAVEQVLARLSQKELNRFTNFSDLFKRVQLSLKLNPEAPFRSSERYSQLYKEVYHVYANS